MSFSRWPRYAIPQPRLYSRRMVDKSRESYSSSCVQKATLTIHKQFTLNASFAGPGFRIPSYVISPFTRGKNVFTEKCDHISNILFLETWLQQTQGIDIFSQEINPWRREHMCNFVNVWSINDCPNEPLTDLSIRSGQIFDFANPDFSVPDIPVAAFPHFNNATQQFDGVSHAQLLAYWDWVDLFDCSSRLPFVTPCSPNLNQWFPMASRHQLLRLKLKVVIVPSAGYLPKGGSLYSRIPALGG